MVSPSGVKHRLFYGWVIVAAFLIIGTLAWGVNSSFGVFLKPMASDFGLSRVAISGVRSVQAVIGSLMSIIGGWALDRFGPRVVILLFGTFIGLGLLLTSQTNAAWQLFITYSLLLSVIGAVYITIMGTVSRWFDKKRGLALGIAGAGSGLGAVVMAHSGMGFWYDQCFFLSRFHRNIYMEISGLPPRNLLNYFPELDKNGEKVIFGSDWPAIPFSIERNVEEIKSLPLSDSTIEGILYRNAERILFG